MSPAENPPAEAAEPPVPSVLHLRSAFMRACGRLLRAVNVLAFCWFGMMWVHESGHVLTCLAAGGSIERVVLAPWGFSRTDPALDPHPLLTVWGGPLLGTLIPLLAWLPLRRLALLRAFAAFCAFANGAYIFFGAFERIADARVMLKLGSPFLLLALFGVVSMLIGAVVAQPLGRWAGLLSAASPYSRRALMLSAVVTVILITVGAACFRDAY